MKRTSTVVITFGIVGALGPISLLVTDRLSHHGWWPGWISYAWPTSYMFIATSAVIDRFWYEIATLSISLNAILYGIIGLMLASLWRRAFGAADGRTR
jgi:hypothetical protein